MRIRIQKLLLPLLPLLLISGCTNPTGADSPGPILSARDLQRNLGERITLEGHPENRPQGACLVTPFAVVWLDKTREWPYGFDPTTKLLASVTGELALAPTSETAPATQPAVTTYVLKDYSYRYFQPRESNNP